MRVVFNYRRSLREPKKIRQITDNYYLPFTIELLPALNFFIFMIITFVIGFFIRKVYPYAFSNTWFVFLVGVPLVLSILVTKIKPEGKNIYRFMFDYVKYLFLIKIPKRKFCNGDEITIMKSNISFKSNVEVVAGSEVKDSIENDKQEYVVNENGRRVRILSNKKRININSKQKRGRTIQEKMENVL